MTRYTRVNSSYLIKGHKYDMLEGSRAQVNNGTAYKTTGGLKKTDLFQNKNGRIVSRKKHITATKEKRLVKAGYGTKKGKFGYVKLDGSRKSKKSRKMKGGKFTQSLNSNPENVSGGNPVTEMEAGPAAVTGGRKHKKHRGGNAMLNSVKHIASGSLSSLANAIKPAMALKQ